MSDLPATHAQPQPAAAIVVTEDLHPTRQAHDVRLVPIQAIDFYPQPKEPAPCSS